MKKTFVAVLCFALLALIGVTMLTAGGKPVQPKLAFASPSSEIVAGELADAKLTTIAGNLSTYKFGVYFCCYGLTISGPDSQVGGPYWDAIPFTPDANYVVTKAQASVGWGGLGTNGVTLSINQDNGGLPGTALKTWNKINLSHFGSCCVVTTGKDSAGIPVTQGTQYWIVVSTSDATKATYDGWAFNSTDMRAFPLAFYNQGIWQTANSILPGYAVLGHK